LEQGGGEGGIWGYLYVFVVVCLVFDFGCGVFCFGFWEGRAGGVRGYLLLREVVLIKTSGGLSINEGQALGRGVYGGGIIKVPGSFRDCPFKTRNPEQERASSEREGTPQQ